MANEGDAFERAAATFGQNIISLSDRNRSREEALADEQRRWAHEAEVKKTDRAADLEANKQHLALTLENYKAQIGFNTAQELVKQGLLAPADANNPEAVANALSKSGDFGRKIARAAEMRHAATILAEKGGISGDILKRINAANPSDPASMDAAEAAFSDAMNIGFQRAQVLQGRQDQDYGDNKKNLENGAAAYSILSTHADGIDQRLQEVQSKLDPAAISAAADIEARKSLKGVSQKDPTYATRYEKAKQQNEALIYTTLSAQQRTLQQQRYQAVRAINGIGNQLQAKLFTFVDPTKYATSALTTPDGSKPPELSFEEKLAKATGLGDNSTPTKPITTTPAGGQPSANPAALGGDAAPDKSQPVPDTGSSTIPSALGGDAQATAQRLAVPFGNIGSYNNAEYKKRVIDDISSNYADIINDPNMSDDQKLAAMNRRKQDGSWGNKLAGFFGVKKSYQQ